MGSDPYQPAHVYSLRLRQFPPFVHFRPRLSSQRPVWPLSASLCFVLLVQVSLLPHLLLRPPSRPYHAMLPPELVRHSSQGSLCICYFLQ